MATFKAGQRVRVVGNAPHHNPAIIGCEGVVIPDAWGGYLACTHVSVRLDGLVDGCKEWAIWPSCLAPLTDPGFDAFMEKVTKPIDVRVPELI